MLLYNASDQLMPPASIHARSLSSARERCEILFLAALSISAYLCVGQSGGQSVNCIVFRYCCLSRYQHGVSQVRGQK